MADKTITYTGKDSTGTVVGPPWVRIPHGGSAAVPAALADMLCEQQPNSFAVVAKTAKKKDDT